MNKNDILFVSFLLAVLLVIMIFVRTLSDEGDRAVVRVDGSKVAEYPLSQDGEYLIEGYGGTNTLVIENGEAYISHASCPNGLCIKTGRVTSVGQSIICLPNRVVVEIAGAEHG